MTNESVTVFEKLKFQIIGLYNEVSVLSKKSPDSPISKFKLKFVNQILETANEILGDNYKPFDGFELFDEDDIPTNSDITLVIAQYVKCLEKFRTDNIRRRSGYWYWVIDGQTSSIETSAPRDLRL